MPLLFCCACVMILKCCCIEMSMFCCQQKGKECGGENYFSTAFCLILTYLPKKAIIKMYEEYVELLILRNSTYKINWFQQYLIVE